MENVVYEFVEGFFDAFGVVGWNECDSVVGVGFNGEDGWFDKFVFVADGEIEEDVVSVGIEEITRERYGIEGGDFDEVRGVGDVDDGVELLTARHY